MQRIFALGVRQLGEMLRPYPPNEVVGVVLVLGEPQLALLGNDIEYLIMVSGASEIIGRAVVRVLPLRLGRSGKDTQPRAWWFRC